jgi:hypothetical protein
MSMSFLRPIVSIPSFSKQQNRCSCKFDLKLKIPNSCSLGPKIPIRMAFTAHEDPEMVKEHFEDQESIDKKVNIQKSTFQSLT